VASVHELRSFYGEGLLAVLRASARYHSNSAAITPERFGQRI
jgi:hypothetical protein